MIIFINFISFLSQTLHFLITFTLIDIIKIHQKLIHLHFNYQFHCFFQVIFAYLEYKMVYLAFHDYDHNYHVHDGDAHDDVHDCDAHDEVHDDAHDDDVHVHDLCLFLFHHNDLPHNTHFTTIIIIMVIIFSHYY